MNQTQIPSSTVPIEISRELARLADEAIRYSPDVQRTAPGTIERLATVQSYIGSRRPALEAWFEEWLQSLRRECNLAPLPLVPA